MKAAIHLRPELVTTRERLERFSRAADENGYEHLWIGDHVALPAEYESVYPLSTTGRPLWTHTSGFLDCMVALAFAAACTTHVRLGTNIVPMFTRDPASLAKQAASLDRVSEGRLDLGLGAGWLVEEAQILGRPFDHPMGRLDEAIDVLRKAWSEDAFTHVGRFFNYRQVGIHPHPIQGADVPIWIGGTTPRALKIVAEKCAGISLWLVDPATVTSVRSRLAEAGGAHAEVAVSLFLDDDREDFKRRAHALREAGADQLVLVWNGQYEGALDAYEWFAANVKPEL